MDATKYYISLRALPPATEVYEFVVVDEDEEFWYSRAGVRFPKASFTVV